MNRSLRLQASRALLLALAVSFAPVLFAPGEAFAARRPTPDVVEDALAFAESDRGKAILLLEEALLDDQFAKIRPTIGLHAGEQHRLAGSVDNAKVHFSKVLESTQDPGELASARLGLVLIRHRVAQDAETWKGLQDAPEKGLLASMNADRWFILARRAASDDDSGKTGLYSRKALAAAKGDPDLLTRIRTSLEALVKPGTKPEPSAKPDPQAEGPLVDADRALDDGDRDKARRLAEKVLADNPDPTVKLAAEYLIRRADATTPVDSDRIAVLLPLSGKYEAVGGQMKDALIYGFGRGGPKKLEFYDTGATAETAVKALEKAVLEDGAIGVIGPLLTEEAPAVLAAAEALRVPTLSLSSSVDSFEGTEWTFQAMISTAIQVRGLVEECMGRRAMKSFAAFAPDSDYGKKAVELFEKAVVARGGTVTAKVFYKDDATDLVPFAKQLGRKDYSARAQEFRDIKRVMGENGGDPGKAVLPPIQDYDALFLPDRAARVPLAAAALGYEEFPLGDFKPIKNAQTKPLIGLSGWNSPTLVNQGGPYLRGGLFTDVFLGPGPENKVYAPDEATKAFIDRFKEATGRTPKPLEAAVVDAGRLMAAASQGEASTRRDLRDALLAAKVNESVTGADDLDPKTREATFRVRLYTITQNGIMAAPDPAPVELPEPAPAPAPP